MSFLLKKSGKYYQLIGFYYFNNSKEYSFPTHGELGARDHKSTHIRVQEVFIRGYGFFADIIKSNITDYSELDAAFISDLGLDISQLFIFHSRLCSFFFAPYQGTLSFDTKYYTDPKKYIFDYVEKGNSVHLLKSSFRMLQDLSFTFSNSISRTSKDIEIINKDNINLFFFENIQSSKTYTPKETKIPEQKTFELCEDYNEELINLKEKIIEKAKNNGGFLKLIFENKEYLIPKVPFIIWSNLIGKQYFTGIDYFSFDNYSWNTVCKDQGIKTDDDSLIHSDWWIGAGLPIFVYTDSYSYYFNFNRAITNFAYEVSKFKLKSAITLAGHDLPPIEGKVVLRPQSLNDFNEDDIIVLPRAGVEFDSFIRKCCKNGKGAVIVEVHNRVSHLVIVSREMNQKGKQFRLLSMPNAYSTLKNNQFYTVDTKNNEIQIYNEGIEIK